MKYIFEFYVYILSSFHCSELNVWGSRFVAMPITFCFEK